MSMSALQLHHSEALELTKYEKVWWDPVHQHFVVMADGAFQALSSAPPDGSGGVRGGSFTRRSPPCAVGGEGRVATLAKFSLDMKLLALQVSGSALVVVDVAGGRQWRIECRGASPGLTGAANLLLRSGFVWSEHGGNSQDLVLVTQRGAELYKVSTKRGQCKLSQSLNYPTNSWWYAAERRLLVLGTGPRGELLRSWFLKAEVAGVPRMELPPPDKVPRFSLPLDASAAAAKPPDVALVCLYGEMYVARVDAVGCAVQLYLIRPKEGVPAWTHTLNLPASLPPSLSNSFELSVLDNLLVVHNKALNTSLLFDLLAPETSESRAASALSAAKASPWARGPNGAPPPKPPPHASTVNPLMALTGRPNPNFAPLPLRSPSHVSIDPIAAGPAAFAPSSPAALLSPGASAGASPGTAPSDVGRCLSPLDLYGKWRLLWPQRVLDTTSAAGVVWELRANVRAFACEGTPADLFEEPLPGVLLRRGVDCRANLLLLNVSGAPGDGPSAAASGAAALLRALAALIGSLDDDASRDGAAAGLSVDGRAKVANAFSGLHEPYSSCLQRRKKLLQQGYVAGSAAEPSAAATSAAAADRAAAALASAAADALALAALERVLRPSSNAAAFERSSLTPMSADPMNGGLPPRSPVPSGEGGEVGSGVSEVMVMDFESRLDLWPGDLDSLGIVAMGGVTSAGAGSGAGSDAGSGAVGFTAAADGLTMDGLTGKALECVSLVDSFLVKASGEHRRRMPQGRPHPPRCPLTAKRVLSQKDVFDFVFGPLAASRAVATPLLISVLVEYLADQKRHKLPSIDPRPACLLIGLLSRTGRTSDLVQLVHYRLVPDSLQASLALLAAADKDKVRARREKKKLANCSRVLEQLSLDGVWRAGEAALVVARFLEDGRFADAINLCMGCLRGPTPQSHPVPSARLVAHLARRSLPATAFVASALAAASRLSRGSPEPEALDLVAPDELLRDSAITAPSAIDGSAVADAPPPATGAKEGATEASRAALMSLLICFLRAWDPYCLGRDPSTGKSHLAAALASTCDPNIAAMLDVEGGVLEPPAARAVRHWLGLDPFVVTR